VTPTPDELAADVRANRDLKRQLAELREAAGEAARRVADTVHDATGVANAADLLAQWEGFGRFCREVLGVEPLVLTAAFGLGQDDLAAEALEAYPVAAADEVDVARWAAEWTGTWSRRFGT
jgi:hypothetical protein